ncbi:MAG: O-antigen ligase family protein [Betaproteobacteria bacterium]|nr:O-antigen ligase family protein [Betaproteobacteria bacterium]
MKQNLFSWTERFGWVLIALFVAVQPFRNTFELPVALMAIFGLLLVLLEPRRILTNDAIKPLIFIFACLWIPMVASLTDAVNFSRAMQTTLVFLRFPLAAIFTIYALQSSPSRARFLMMLGVVLSFFVLGKVIYVIEVEQSLPDVVSRWAWLGHVIPQRGVGHILAVLSPIYFYWMWKQVQHRQWVLLATPVYAMAILLSGARVAWIMLLVGFLLLLMQMFWMERTQWRWKTVFTLVLIWGVALGITLQYSTLQQRIERTAGLFSGNYEKANTATSLRLPIWEVSIKVAKDHLINGIGPRGFRYIYPDYVPKDDYWMRMQNVDKSTGKTVLTQTGPTHPHQLLLEILVETGIIGVFGYLAALVFKCITLDVSSIDCHYAHQRSYGILCQFLVMHHMVADCR